MSTPNIDAREDNEGQGSVTLPFSVSNPGQILRNSSELNELNCMGLSDCSSSVDSSSISIASAESTSKLNLKATELRLGLPGSQSPKRDVKLDEKPLFSLLPVGDDTSSSSHKTIVSGIKRGFPGTHSGFSEGKIYNLDVNVGLSPRPRTNLNIISDPLKECSTVLAFNVKEAASSLASKDRAPDVSSCVNLVRAANHRIAPAPKAQVVGWPPIRSYRKNSIATTSKNTGDVDSISRKGVLFVKVSMDGAPYLRKVDIKAYTTYQELSSALGKMFSCFSIGQSKSKLTVGEEVLGDNKLKDLIHSSEYVLAYEDKDSDWMLVGDVPWEMFTDTCRRLRIMKSSDAIGLAPRAAEKCWNRS